MKSILLSRGFALTADLLSAIIDKLILLVALAVMGYGIFHLAHHDPQSNILEWAKSTFTIVLGSLLTLIRGTRVRLGNGNGNSNGNGNGTTYDDSTSKSEPPPSKPPSALP